MSECGVSWLMKPRGVAVIGSQCQKAPAFGGAGVYGEGDGLPPPGAAVGPPQFAVHLCQLWWRQQDCQWWSGNAQRRSLGFISCTKFRQESGSFIPPNQLTGPSAYPDWGSHGSVPPGEVPRMMKGENQINNSAFKYKRFKSRATLFVQLQVWH